MTKKTFKFPCEVLIKTKKSKLHNLPLPYLFEVSDFFWQNSVQTNCLIVEYDEEDWELLEVNIHLGDEEQMLIVSVTNAEKQTRKIFYVAVNNNKDSNKFKQYVLKTFLAL